ncbi:competence protein ComEC [Fervidobacterium thailandense]|uniref:Competence protein ComEC n=1 Tax=Fervidobacterium thailandense TaxID=1008305 RepID=A0A1E3G5N3_9BACT|nr:competence protein ComEC [Fervidobacterium thailandense]
MGTAVRFPPYCLLATFALYKRPKVALFLFFLFFANLVLVTNSPLEVVKNVEFVGTVKSVQGESSILSLSYYDGRRWRKLGFDVRLYERLDVGTIVYLKGELRRAKSYPVFYVKPRVIVKVKNYVSLRSKIFETFQRFRDFSREVEPFYPSLFGDASRDESFVKSGLFHIFCVSGMHVSMLYVISDKLISLLIYRRNARLILPLIFPTVFVVGSGLNVPAVRALLMIYVSVLFKLVDVKVNPVNVVSLTGLFMVLFNPEIVFSLSFYMTFLATLGVLVYEGKFKNIVSGLGGFLGSAPFVSLISDVNVFSPIATLIVGFPVQIIMFGLTSAFATFVLQLHALAKLILKALLPFVWFVRFIASLFSRLPLLPSHWIIAIAFGFTFGVYISLTEELEKLQ